MTNVAKQFLSAAALFAVGSVFYILAFVIAPPVYAIAGWFFPQTLNELHTTEYTATIEVDGVQYSDTVVTRWFASTFPKSPGPRVDATGAAFVFRLNDNRVLMLSSGGPERGNQYWSCFLLDDQADADRKCRNRKFSGLIFDNYRKPTEVRAFQFAPRPLRLSERRSYVPNFKVTQSTVKLVSYQSTSSFWLSFARTSDNLERRFPGWRQVVDAYIVRHPNNSTIQMPAVLLKRWEGFVYAARIYRMSERRRDEFKSQQPLIIKRQTAYPLLFDNSIKLI